MTTFEQTVWDGVENAYLPAAELSIDPGLRLHRETAEVDPFQFEVLRHNLWNINDEHGVTILKVTGSPAAYTAEDFATSIMTEDGEFVFFGPRNQTLSGTTDMQVKWVLENRSSWPGIEPGDMFLGNDPWIGSTHQQDVALVCPVFWEGEIFCWVANALHQYDIGGSTPGGFCPDATDTFMEPVCIPPVKVVEGDRIRPDIEQFYLRHSRMPDLVALDLRAQIAGNRVARDRVLELIRRYGAAVVKGAMGKIVDDAESVFAAKLERLPEGTFRSRSYVEVALDGDRGLYPLNLQVRKEGSRLIFSMEGSAPQEGALSISFAAWRSNILAAVNPMLAYDVLYAAGGPLRRIEFRPESGTVCCARRPGAISMPQGAGLISGGLAIGALSRMIAFDDELVREAFATGGSSTFVIDSMSGINQWGAPYGTILLDPMLGATGAFTSRDGVDTGGNWWVPRSVTPNVEENEQNFPILYLYRREWSSSGGAGRFRGGNSALSAFVAHGTERIDHSSASPGLAVPTSEGIFGGLPASPSRFRFVGDSDVRASMGDGRIPEELDDLAGERHEIRPKHRGIVQGPDDVIEVAWSAGGGIGDPLDRDPAAVLSDVREGAVEAGWAERVYGVVVADGELDEVATTRRREQIRAERLGGDEARPGNGGDKGLRMWDVLEAVPAASGFEYRCGSCATVLARPGEGSYKDGATLIERPVAESVPHSELAQPLVDDAVIVREFGCPGCGRLLATEVARGGDEVLVDVELG